MAKTYVRRTFKDTLFRMIFSGKEELLSLYNAINHSAYENPEELEVLTIEDVLYMGMKNDVAFLVDDYLNLYEAQSSWNPNMPLRGLFYFSRLYQGYVEKNHLDVHSRVTLRIPTPKYIVFYNGTEKTEERRVLHLSDSFLKEDGEEFALECTAVLLNVNYGNNETIMKNCRKLKEYAYLVEEIRISLQDGLKLEEAVDRAVVRCIEQGVLEDFLRKHRAEVKDMILSEYNEELHIKNEKKLSILEAKREDILTLLGEVGPIPDSLRKRIQEETDETVLKTWLKTAARVETPEEFAGKCSLNIS